MFEKLDAPLPDTGRFLERIGCGDIDIKNDLKTLNRLISAFVTSVPYENLTISCLRRIPSLASADIYEKFVNERRGGYCFEMNGAFRLLLRDLGFDVYSVSAYVLEYKDEMGDLGHRANVITLGGEKYIADVGFGGKNTSLSAVPMALLPGEGSVLRGSEKDGFFVMYDRARREYTLCKKADEEAERKAGRERFIIREEERDPYIKILMFRDFSAYPQEFYLPNIGVFYLEGNPMIDNVLVNLKNSNGDVYTIYNDIFRGKNSSGPFERRLESDEDFREVLKSAFGMEEAAVSDIHNPKILPRDG